MKTVVTFSLFICIGLLSYASSIKYPDFNKNHQLKSGDIVSKTVKYKNKYYTDLPKQLDAETYTIAVPENHNNINSKIITLPILKIKSLTNKPKEPVFLFYGGPGIANTKAWTYPHLYLLNNHDVVIVGYRGVEGSVNLESKAIAKSFKYDSEVFSEEHITKMANIVDEEFTRFKAKGIDINQYNIIAMVDDFELARKALGYNKINIIGQSYGTRLGYLYGLKYPESTNRTYLKTVNPPGKFVWEAKVLDSILLVYGEIWKKDTSNLSRSVDIVATIKSELNKLPVKWKKINIDAAKIKATMFNVMYSVEGSAQVFDAFIAAENGDYSGLAFMNMMYDMFSKMEYNWGDSFVKAMSADFDKDFNYLTGTESEIGLMGAYMSKAFATQSISNNPLTSIPEKFRSLDTSYVETLLLNGDLDVSTPINNAKAMINYLPNGHLVILNNYSHSDLGKGQYEIINKMVSGFFLTGKVDTSNLIERNADLGIPHMTAQKMGKTFYVIKRLGLMGLTIKLMM